MKINTKKCYELPENYDLETVYILEPKNFDKDAYLERVNRNIGLLTEEEQLSLLNKTIAVAGCGGMGGESCILLLRAGVGTIVIADPGIFDEPDINRQYAASQLTLGGNKAIETAKKMREIASDTTIIVFPQGVTENTVNEFLKNTDMVFDTIDFWAIYERALLGEKIREFSIPMFNACSLGFGTVIQLFTSDSMSMCEKLGVSLEEAKRLGTSIKSREIAPYDDLLKSVTAIAGGLIPKIPKYMPTDLSEKNLRTGAPSVFSSNPPLAIGAAVNTMILYLLQVERGGIKKFPKAPAYLKFDIATMNLELVNEKKGFNHTKVFFLRHLMKIAMNASRLKSKLFN